MRQLEGQKDTEWSPQASSSRHSPYGEQHAAGSTSSNADDDKPKRKGLPDWTVLRELGTHVVDEDGFTRYMGPSSGVSLAARCLQTILDDDDQPQDPEFYCLFSLEDFARNRALAAADVELFTLQPYVSTPCGISDLLKLGREMKHTSSCVVRIGAKGLSAGRIYQTSN